MKVKLHRFFIGLMLALSVVHIAAASVIFSEIKASLAWFIGVGFMGIFLAFLNIIAARLPENRLVTQLCLAANAVGIFYAFGNAWIENELSALIVTLFFIGLAVTAPLPGPKSRPAIQAN